MGVTDGKMLVLICVVKMYPKVSTGGCVLSCTLKVPTSIPGLWAPTMDSRRMNKGVPGWMVYDHLAVLATRWRSVKEVIWYDGSEPEPCRWYPQYTAMRKVLALGRPVTVSVTGLKVQEYEEYFVAKA